MSIELTRKPASASSGGELTTGSQTIAGDKSFTGGDVAALQDPTLMSNELATKLGKFIYVDDGSTTYNSGNRPDITVANAGGDTLGAIQKADFIPYQIQNGNWRLKFHIRCSLVGSNTKTAPRFTVTSVRPSVTQGFHGFINQGTNTIYQTYAEAGVNPGEFQFVHSSTTNTEYLLWGDIELAYKPNWAY